MAAAFVIGWRLLGTKTPVWGASIRLGQAARL